MRALKKRYGKIARVLLLLIRKSAEAVERVLKRVPLEPSFCTLIRKKPSSALHVGFVQNIAPLRLCEF
jgi:hypothetical protein